MPISYAMCGRKPGPVFCLLLNVSSDYAQPITGQVTKVTCPVIGWAQPERTPSKRPKTGPDGVRLQMGKSQQYCLFYKHVLKIYGQITRIPNNISTHWGRDKMATIFQTIFSNAFSWTKTCEFRLRFHWSLFLRLQLTIFHHWFR